MAEAAPEKKPHDAAADEHMLDPAKLKVFRAEDGTPRLEIEGDRTVLRLRVARLFPITRRREFISFADGDDTEIGVLRELRSLPKPMRRIVLEELRRQYFVPEITRVHSLKDEFGVLYWDVDTSRGRRKFVVREARDNIREFESGRMQITDVDGNLFEIPDIDRLPGKDVGELYRLL
ncbi:MAG: DUF1854 domain-containing protein [Armatimonadetes bacterium]|jgi:hypothetical protein|nr:DUF1854 domain-containing protein [Armatimonadota bacterium]MDI9584616.1 DUF1854 domain-containing protein [Acidobacteriota bacterium]